MQVPFFGYEPHVPDSAWVDPQATLIGRVVLGEQASIYPQAVLRGDINAIVVGDRSNVQDGSVLHVADEWPVLIGREVVIGHAATVHGCEIQDGCLVGIGATVLNGAVVGEGSILAAGCLVPENAHLEAGGLYMGVPARLKRRLSAEEQATIRGMARKYAFLAAAYKANAAALERGERLDTAAWEERLADFHTQEAQRSSIDASNRAGQ